MFQSPNSDKTGGATKLRVLVVDDEPTLRLGFAYALSSRTTTVETAANGRHALDRMGETEFNILVLDLRMPDLDGLGVIDALRSQGNNIPVVLCSAALSPNAALHAVRQGVVDFLPKPVRPVDLRKVIEFILQPERQPFPQAMRAARSGRHGEAIRILSEETAPCRQAASWLEVLVALQEAGASCNKELVEKIRRILPILNFNSCPPP